MPDIAGNSLATATTLNLTATAQSFPDLVTPQNNDYYRFALTTRSSLNLSLAGLDANADVELLDRAGNLVSVDGVALRSTNSGTFTEVINTTLDPGLYYVRVFPGTGVSQSNYTLNIAAQDNLVSSDLLWRFPGLTALWQLDEQLSLVASPLFSNNLPASWIIGGTGDFNRDGKTDIIWRNNAAALTDIWFMDGTTLLSSVGLFPTRTGDWEVGGTGDFNKDGWTDIVWRLPAQTITEVWFMDGTTLLSSAAIGANSIGAGVGWEIGAIGDFNKDGDLDLLWQNRAFRLVGFWLLDGLNLDVVVPVATLPDSQWVIAGAEDYNNDGNLDVLLRHYAPDGVVAGWIMDRTSIVRGFQLQSLDPAWFLEVPYRTYGEPLPFDLAGSTQATAFDLGRNLGGTATYRDRIGGGTDPNDFFQFNVATEGRVTLSLTDFNADLDLGLYDSTGVLIQASTQVGTTPEAIVTQLAAGTYFIQVNPFNPSEATPYALSLSINTPPRLISNNVLTLSEQGTASLTNTILRVTDADNLATELLYTVGSLPVNGALLLNGVTATAGATFTQADIDQGNRIQYLHNGSETTSDRFTFSLTDGSGGAIELTTFTINVTPVNDAPIITTNTGLTLSEGAIAALTSSQLQATDPEGQTPITYSLNSLPTNGGLRLGTQTLSLGQTFTQADLANSQVSYIHNGSETTTDSFRFSVVDAGGAIAAPGTFSISVLPVNDAPVLTLPTTTQSVDQGTNSLIAGVRMADVDLGTGELTVTLAADNGVLTLGRTAGITLLTGDGTQDNLISFRGAQDVTNFVLQSLIYRSGTNFQGDDLIRVTVNDGGNTGLGGPLSATGAITLNVAPINDAPILTVPGAQTVREDIATPILGINIADPDIGNSLVRVSLFATNGTLSLSSIAGVTLNTGTGTADKNLVFTGPLGEVNRVLSGLLYQGDRDFNGADLLTISVSDTLNGANGIPLSDTETIAITVTPVNDAPVLTVPAAQRVNENTDLNITGIAVADIDAAGDLTVNVFASRGQLSLSSIAGLAFDLGDGVQDEVLTFRGAQAAINNALRTLTYRPNADFNGNDTISLNVSDGGNTGLGGVLGDAEAIGVTVLGLNSAPSITAPTTSFAVDSDTPLAIRGLQVNDPDVGGGLLAVSLAAENGVLSLGNTAGLTFARGDGAQDPRLAFSGTIAAVNAALSELTYRSYPGFTNQFDRITLSVNDNGNTGIGVNLSDTEVLLVNVGGAVNQLPIAVGDSFTVLEEGTLNATSILVNDSDPDFTLPLTAVLVAGPTNALAFTLNPNGTFTYAPTANFSGSDSFSYRAVDVLGGASNLATVAITVTGSNDAPIAVDDSFTTLEDQPIVNASVLTNDTDIDSSSLTAQLIAAPANASNFTLNPNGTFSYTPQLNFSGSDRFTYRLLDPLGAASNPATVSLTITPVNDAPVAQNDGVFTVAAGGTLAITGAGVLSNDTDVDTPLANLTASLVSTTPNGNLTLNPNGSFTYQPSGSFAGVDTFTYVASDGSLTSNLATVTISVAGNTAPIGNADSFTLGEDTTLVTGNGLIDNPVARNIQRVSLSTSGNEGSGTDIANSLNAYYRSDISGDGRYVVFSTDAQGLVAGDTNARLDVFLRDRQTGTTTLISAAVGGGVPNGASSSPVISADGRYIVFYSNASNIDAQGLPYSGFPSFYVHDRQTGITRRIASDLANTVRLVSTSKASISSDGRYIAYSILENLPSIISGRVYVYDQQTGVSTEIGLGLLPLVSDDGRYVAFQEEFIDGDNGLFLRDRQTGNTITFAEVGQTFGLGDFTPDGRYLAFTSYSSNLVPGDTNNSNDVFVFDRQTGQTSRVSLNSNGNQGDFDSFTPSISADGRFVSFHSLATNLIEGDTNAVRDVFVRDRLTGKTTRISVNASGQEGNERSFESQISADGRFVSFTSDATNLVNGDTNTSRDVFVAQIRSSTLAQSSILTNDTDLENNVPLTATLATTPTNALSFTLNADGSFNYTPTANFNGVDSFTYQAIDRLGAISAPTTVGLTVTAINDAPVAVNDTLSVSPGATLNVTSPGILANDTDIDSPTLTAVLVSTAANGALTLNPNGSFTYQPNAGFQGTDSFTYQANDGSLNSANPATVSIVVTTAANSLPIAAPDGFTTPEDTSLTIGNILTNDTDPDGNLPLTASLVAAPTNALSFTLNPDGTFSYLPNLNFNGTDTLVYSAIDAVGGISAPATVTFSVTPVNDAPTALNETYTVITTSSLNITAPGVLANDTDVDNPVLTASLVATAANGTLNLNPDGAFTYQPNAGFSGTDSFTYQASDGSLTSNLATVNIAVSSVVNSAPVVVTDVFSAIEDTPLTIGNVLANDTDTDGNLPLTASLVAAPANALSFTLNPDGTFNYVPRLNFNGADTFTYVAVDSLGARSQTATVTFNVAAVNDAPIASNDAYNIAPAGTLNVTIPGILANDTDVDGNPLTASLVTGPTGATVFSLNPDGSFTYSPQVAFAGPDSFTYQVSDGTTVSNLATVSIVITANQFPTATPDTFTTQEDTPLTIGNVLTNDTDPDGNLPLTASLIAAPTNALSFTLNPDGTFSYVPRLNFNGTDTFTYAAIDRLGGTSTPTTVTFSVTPVNDLPTAVNDSVFINAGAPATITAPGVLANDTDPDGNPLTASLLTNATSGTVALNGNGSFVYTPNAGFFGVDSFTYAANDGTGNSLPATVTVRVNGIPTASNDTYTAAIGSPLSVLPIQGVLANDGDPEGAVLTASVVTNPAQGNLTLNPDGSFLYTSNGGAAGTDSFIYRATDGLASATATVTIALRTNSAPIAVSDTYRLPTNGTLNVEAIEGVLQNDSDPDAGTALSATLLSPTTQGALTLNPNGTFTYIPQAGFQGTDSFVYRASDGITVSGPATVTLSVSNNTPPVANNDTFTAFSGIPRIQTPPGVRGNDADANGDNLTIFLVSNPANGSVTLSPDGSFIYTANASFQGADTFVYRAFDGVASSTATVTMSVTLNSPPTAGPDTYGAIAGETLSVTAPGVLVNDSDPEGTLIAQGGGSPPTNGVLLVFNNDGSFVYVPNPGFTGVDRFTYRASDGVSEALTTVTINVAANAAPTAVTDNYSVNPNNVLTVPRARGVLANDTDPNGGQVLSASVVTNPTQGALSLNPDGSFTYTPNVGATGTDRFTYRATDGTFNSTATVTIAINTASTPPAALNDGGFTVSTNGTLNITAAGVLANDTDTDGDLIRASLTTNAGNGTVSLNPNGSFQYRPNAGFQGTDTFTYQAIDGLTASTPATVFVTVGGANAAPVVTLPGSQLIQQNSTLTLASGLSVSDLDAGSSPVQLTLSATNGSLTLGSLAGLSFTAGDGTADSTMTFTGTIASINSALTNLQFTPNAGYTGAAQITIVANDQGATGTGGAQTGSGTVNINVAAGATLVSNINPGSNSSSPSGLVSFGNTVYFAATDPIGGTELWSSDGTGANTRRVADINAGSAGSSPTNLIVVGNTLFYTATTPTTERELWRTDLTTGTGATLVGDIRPGFDASNPQSLTNYANTLFFVATDGVGGARQLWRVDGTGNPVKVLNTLTNVSNLAIAGSTLYFTSGNGAQLWRVDTPTSTPVQVRDLGGTAAISNLTAVGDRLFFTARDGAGVELWSSAGTAANTSRVTDLNPGTGNANPANLIAFNGNLYFFAQDSTGGAFKLFQSTPAGVVSPIATLPATGSPPAQLTAVGGRLFFVVDTGTLANPSLQLWSSDGSSTASLVRDLNAGNDAVSSLTSFNGALFFVANDGTGFKVFRSDGSAANTIAVSGAFTVPPAGLTAAGNRLLFTATDATNGSELWTVG